jgi:hypothetical protein
MANIRGFLASAAAAVLTAAAVTPALAQTDYLPRNVRIDVEFKEYGVRSSSYTKQFIVVSDGLSASIFVGEEVPYVEYYVSFLYDNAYIASNVTIKEVGTRLKVEPRIIDNGSVEITLTPQISYLADRRRGVIDIQKLSTTVIAYDGRPLVIGGLEKDRDFGRHFFTTSSSRSLEIILTPHIQ